MIKMCKLVEYDTPFKENGFLGWLYNTFINTPRVTTLEEGEDITDRIPNARVLDESGLHDENYIHTLRELYGKNDFVE
ncbi:hypothetical protein J4414_00585 [Candidatus Woesearchaeota archaeon]|nr:hypothetical protein [Candidatus Woesearchaeota archaeon]